MYAEHREQVIKKACPPFFFGEVKVIVNSNINFPKTKNMFLINRV